MPVRTCVATFFQSGVWQGVRESARNNSAALSHPHAAKFAQEQPRKGLLPFLEVRVEQRFFVQRRSSWPRLRIRPLCDYPGCSKATSDRKSYCFDHTEFNDYAIEVLRKIASDG